MNIARADGPEPIPTILIAGGDPDGCAALDALLQNQGYTLVLAATGVEALARASELTPDLILLDAVMPGMDGFEVCRRVRADPRLAGIPIVLVTARDDRAARLEGLDAGADDFLARPFDPIEVRARVRTIARLNVRDLAERKRTEQALRANQERLQQMAETLRAASLALTQTLDPDTVLDTLLDHLAQLVPYDSASAMLCEDTQVVVRSVRGEARWGASPLTRDMTLDAEASPQLRALLAAQASILIADTASVPSWEALGGSNPARSWLGVPLMAGRALIGLYALDKRQPGFFTDEHRHVAESLAAQAAVAVQNARLFGEVSAGRERLQILSRRLVEVQEAERAQIARELHDEIGQVLTGLNLVLEVSPQTPAETLAARVAEAQALVNDLTTRVRELSLDLRPAMLDDLGLLPTLLWHVKRYTAQTQIRVTVKHAGLEGRVAANVEIAAYRIAQEALTNIARHAKVQAATVRLWISGEVLGVQVQDQGRGFDPDAVLAAHRSSGLAGMIERARLLGGQVTIESAPGQGTHLTAELPLGPPIDRRRKPR